MNEDYEKLLRSHRKKVIFDPVSLPVRVSYGREAIEKIIPHRDPLLFLDGIDGLDVDTGRITGYREISPEDPVFHGHFPGHPIYPGSYTVEMIGQLGLCLYHFNTVKDTHIENNPVPVGVRATRILGAYFLEPIHPGDRVVLLGEITDSDGFFGRAIGQAVVNGTVCCVSAAEVCFI